MPLAVAKRAKGANAVSATCRLAAPLAVSILGASIAVAETTTVGAVDKVQASVEARQAGRTRALAVNSDVYFRDRCHSGEGARLQATLKDGTQLTLGENSTLVVDEFIYDPSRSRGELSLRVVKGAFLYVGGLIEGEAGAKVRIHTPVGAIGGTNFSTSLLRNHCDTDWSFTRPYVHADPAQAPAQARQRRRVGICRLRWPKERKEQTPCQQLADWRRP